MPPNGPFRKRITRKTPALGRPQLTYNEQRRLFAARSKEYTLQGLFKYGYRNKEDISNLPAQTLVVGSQNVLTNAAEQIVIRNGYQLDGLGGTQSTYGIDSAFDFNTHSFSSIQNVRKWGANLEMRYVNPVSGLVSWINLLSTLSVSNICNFAEFWDQNTELKNFMLFVNGNNNVYEWTGASAGFLSATATTITVQGTNSLSNLNFYNNAANTGKMQLLINGILYKYTGAGNTASIPYTQSPVNNKIASTTTQWNSQKFTTGASAISITSAVLTINSSTQVNNSYNFAGSIYTDNAGVPGTLVANSLVYGSIPAGGSSGDYSVTFTFQNGLALSAGTIYHFVVSSDQTNTNVSVYTGTNGSAGTNKSTDSGVTWANQNGYMNLVINENDTGNTIFTGVTPNPTLVTINVGDAVIQSPVVGTATLKSASLPTIDLISTLRNQVYYGSFSNQNVYISKVNNYSDCTQSTPRVVGEGNNVVLDAPPLGFIAEQDAMYIGAGKNFWYRTKFTLSADLTKEAFEINRLKTSSNQGAISQGLMSKFKNSVAFISNEPILNLLGSVRSILIDVQMVNISDPIKYDMDAYNFAGGNIHYNNYFVYFSIPKMGVIRAYNVQRKYWEAPQTIPVGFFYEVNGQLCGHSGTTNESYALFVSGIFRDGGTVNGSDGNPISAVAAFPYLSTQGGSAVQKKNFNKHYTEGYIAGNSALTLTVNYDFGGFSGSYSASISGMNKKIIFNKITDGSLGANTLGSQPIGTILNLPNQPPIPKFRQINTFPRVNCYEYQLVYSSNDLDQNWALLRVGPAISAANDLPGEIST